LPGAPTYKELQMAKSKGITIRMNAAENTMDVYGKKYDREDHNKLLMDHSGEVAFTQDVVDHVCEVRGLNA